MSVARDVDEVSLALPRLHNVDKGEARSRMASFGLVRLACGMPYASLGIKECQCRIQPLAAQINVGKGVRT